MAEPTWDSTDPIDGASVAQQQAASQPVAANVPTWDNTQDLQAKYGNPVQQVLAGIEGAAQGAIGPFAPAIERGLGVKPEGIRGREEANPWTHGISEAIGLGGSAMLGIGEAPLVNMAGEGAAKLAGLGAEGASTISKIASQGIKTGAEMAAIQGSDELSKMVALDPGQTLGTAAINVGLSGIIGGAGGAAIGAVSPLWTASMERIGVPKLIDEAKAQYNFRQGLSGGDVPTAVTEELNTRLGEMENLHRNWDNVTGKSLERAMPEVTQANSEKINTQIEQIASDMTRHIEKAADNAYLKGSVPKLAQDLQEFLEVVTDPNATYADKFGAINDLKRAQWAKGKFSLTAEESALGKFTNKIGHDLSEHLENSSVWGDAARVQKDSNEAVKSFLDAQKPAVGKFTKTDMNGISASQDKVTTLINQSLKGRGIDKTNAIRDYIAQSDKLADVLNKIHTEAGLDAPIRITPTPALHHVLGTKASAGVTLGNWIYEKGLATAAGQGLGSAVGAGVGSLIGHPAIGALAGERILAPVLTSMAKPLLEGASRSEALKASVDYLGNVIRGQKIFNNAVGNFFKSGAEVLGKTALPTSESREHLETSLDSMKDTQTAMNVGGNLGHYLGPHATAATTAAASAKTYFDSLKPRQAQRSPLDKPSPIDPVKQQAYERQLDIAQQPLLVLKHAKNGELQIQDVKTLNALYPALQKKIAASISKELIHAQADGKEIPYNMRHGLSLLMGQPLDSTYSQQGMASIIMANAPKGKAQQQGQSPHVSKSTAASQAKISQLYATPNQASAARRGSP